LGAFAPKGGGLCFEGIWCLYWQSVKVGQVGKSVREGTEGDRNSWYDWITGIAVRVQWAALLMREWKKITPVP
jgi:hypothetical protein